LLVYFEIERKGIGKGYRGEDGSEEIGERVRGVKEEEWVKEKLRRSVVFLHLISSHSTALYNTIQCSTAQQCTAQHSTVLYGTTLKSNLATTHLHCEPPGHTAHTASPPGEYVPSTHGIAVLLCVDGQEKPGGQAVQEDCSPVL
jgi:hypothetical protein